MTGNWHARFQLGAITGGPLLLAGSLGLCVLLWMARDERPSEKECGSTITIVITCDQCKKRASSPGHRTVTQRVLCDDCHNRMLGAAAGILSAGPGASTTSTVQSAVATSGLFASMRRWREARRSHNSASRVGAGKEAVDGASSRIGDT